MGGSAPPAELGTYSLVNQPNSVGNFRGFPTEFDWFTRLSPKRVAEKWTKPLAKQVVLDNEVLRLVHVD